MQKALLSKMAEKEAGPIEEPSDYGPEREEEGEEEEAEEADAAVDG